MSIALRLFDSTRGPWETPDGSAGEAAAPEGPRTKIASLAAIWPPFAAASGVIQNPTPVGQAEIEDVEQHGYVVVAPVDGYEPYTHIISTGNHDYLAALDVQTPPGEAL